MAPSSIHSFDAELPAFGRGRYPVILGLMSQLASVVDTNSTTNSSTTSTVAALLTQTMHDLDVLWVLLATSLVFLMQTGFSFLEAGSLRSTSVVNVLTKVSFVVFNN